MYEVASGVMTGKEFVIFGIPGQIAHPIKQGLYGRTIILSENGISLGSMIEGIDKSSSWYTTYP
ncbi:MAG: hypothetical protein FGF52_00665 [Candidatus Brockarchaeota archaeon]|nr:hypothetical protein [Candidatus Brockarchaeota archaeon]